MPFEVTTAVRKMLAMESRKKVVQGATSSGKTAGIIPIAIDRCLENKRYKATVVAESIPAVKDGAVKIFKDFMMDEGRWNDLQWIGNPMEYTFRNGSVLQFKSFDSVGKAKAAGKRDLLFINEGNHISYEIADALMIRSKEIWVDFNADRSFWAHTSLLKEPNAEFLKLTYLDNEAIPPETLEDLMHRKSKAEAEERAGIKGYWWNWWQVYGLGEIGSLQGVVFNNWKQIDFVPEGAKLLGYGLDFGYTNDPTALVAIYEYNGQKILDEVVYQVGLKNSDRAALFEQNGAKPFVIYADKSAPENIAELRQRGFHVIPYTSQKVESIKHGISLMQESEFLVTKRSHNLITELQNYIWFVDKEGNNTNEPIETFNHAIDAARYWFLSSAKNTGKYVIR